MSTSRPASPAVEESVQPAKDEDEDLSSTVASLREELASAQTQLQTQSTRLASLSDLEPQLAQVKDQHAFLSAAKEAVEAQLKDERSKREQAEEQVEALQAQVDALRGQVEQARRGVMQLQKQEKERKRASQMVLPHNMAALGLGGPSAGAGGGGLESPEEEKKRESFMKTKAHRRVSSQSENSIATSAGASATVPDPPARQATGLRELRLGQHAHAAPTSPSAQTITLSPAPVDTSPPGPAKASPPAPPAKDYEPELASLRTEVLMLQRRLGESEEARQASESCLKALREFIASPTEKGVIDLTSADIQGIRLPPLPTDREPDDVLEAPVMTKEKSGSGGKGTGGWGFKLWKQAPGTSTAATPGSPALSTAVEAPNTPQPVSPAVTSSRMSGTSRISPLPTPGISEDAPAPTGTPLSNLVNWTKSVVPGPPGTPGIGASGPPALSAGTRKLSNFFSRSGKEGAGDKGKEKDKDLPPPPSAEGLEPSPMIADADQLEEVPLVGEAKVEELETKPTDMEGTEMPKVDESKGAEQATDEKSGEASEPVPLGKTEAEVEAGQAR